MARWNQKNVKWWRAQAVWEKALKDFPENEKLREVMRRFFRNARLNLRKPKSINFGIKPSRF